MDLRDLYTDIIREHSSHSDNRRRIENPTIAMPGNNPSCGDEIVLELDEDDGAITDAAFTGSGCAISQASVSIMTDLIKGKTLEEARELAGLFLSMSHREKLTEEQLDELEEAAALENIGNMPARVKCATMPWHTLIKAINTVESK